RNGRAPEPSSAKTMRKLRPADSGGHGEDGFRASRGTGLAVFPSGASLEDSTMFMLPTTVDRVPQHTAPEVNEKIRRDLEASVEGFAAAEPEAIERRLHELDAEWDIDRTVETSASIIVLAGLFLGGLNPWFVLISAVGGAFLLVHALEGWS